jgi:hypothetical protein
VKQETLITIKGKRKADERRKGQVVPARFREEPDRRRGQKKFLNVIDLGQYTDGTDTYLHTFQRTVTTPYEVRETGFPVASTNPRLNATFLPGLDTAAVRNATWNADYLALDRDEWLSTFKNITADLDTYDIQIVGFDSYISGKGLVTSSEIAAIEVRPEVDTTENRDQWFYRTRDHFYTNEPDPASDPVSFTFDRSCDLFLVPVKYSSVVYACRVEAATSKRYSFEAFCRHKQAPRSVLLNNADWDDYWTNKTNVPSIGASARAMLRDVFITVDNAEIETWRRRRDPGPPFFPIDADSPVLVPSFPAQGDFADWNRTPRIERFEGQTLLDHTLVGVIRKRGLVPEWLYIWTDGVWVLPDAAWGIEIVV